MASAGCVGELCAFLSEEELKNVLQQHVLGKITHIWGLPVLWDEMHQEKHFSLELNPLM